MAAAVHENDPYDVPLRPGPDHPNIGIAEPPCRKMNRRALAVDGIVDCDAIYMRFAAAVGMDWRRRRRQGLPSLRSKRKEEQRGQELAQAETDAWASPYGLLITYQLSPLDVACKPLPPNTIFRVWHLADIIFREGPLRPTDYRAKRCERRKIMTLAVDEFIRRFLIHVLPNGFHGIRHCGLSPRLVRR